MKYLEGINFQTNDRAYINSHFEEEQACANVSKKETTVKSASAQKDDSLSKVPPEFSGVPAENIKLNIVRLEQAMEAELASIESRYRQKIDYLK